jgi:hypothetical protein
MIQKYDVQWAQNDIITICAFPESYVFVVMLDRPGIQGAGCINEPFSLSWMYVHGRT